MAKRYLLCPMLLAIGLRSPLVGSDEANDRHALEQQLAAVIRWEVLWDDSPAGFHPNDGKAGFALALSSNSLSYCSHDVGACARYRIDPNRNWGRNASTKCDGGQSDEQALLSFLGFGLPQEKLGPGSRPGPTLGPGGLTGHLTPGSPVFWTAAIGLGSRDEIVQQYRQIHPQAIDGLEEWIRASVTREAGIGSITVACFAPTDPMVYYYVDRPTKGSVEMAVYWNSERQQWAVASSLERSQGPQRFEETHRIIDSVPCATLRFE